MFFLMAIAIGAVVLLSLIGVGIMAVMLSRKSHRQFQKRSLEAEKIDSMLKSGKITESEAGELKKAIGARMIIAEPRRDDKHIRILALLEIICAVLSIAVIILWFVFGLFMFNNLKSHDLLPPWFPALFLSILGLVTLFTLVLMIIRLVAALKLKKGSMPAKTIILILSVLDLISPPIGTALGVYAFWVLLFREGTEEYFEDLSR